MSGLRGSERHIRWYANDGRKGLDAAIFTALPSLASAAADGELEWLSPIPPDYEELRNERFIRALGLDDHLEAFRAFWPFSGKGTPNWDAVAKARLDTGGGAVLVEAKANRGEFDKRDDASTATDPASQAKIDRGLQAARRFYGVSPTAPDWRHSYYQVSNRLTHLSWMCAKADMPDFLLGRRVWVLEFCLYGQLGPIRPQRLHMDGDGRLHRVSSLEVASPSRTSRYVP